MAAGVVRVVQRLRETLEEHTDSIDLSACEMTNVPVAVNVMLAEVADDVRVASLADNILKSLPSNFLSTFSRLHELHLQGNRLKSLPDAVASLTELHFIDISRNCFVTFPDSLTATPSLRTIDVSHNSLQELPAEKLAAMPSLASLIVTANPLTQDAVDSLSLLTDTLRVTLAPPEERNGHGGCGSDRETSVTGDEAARDEARCAADVVADDRCLSQSDRPHLPLPPPPPPPPPLPPIRPRLE
ncbi:leucine-rich repeat-containing protein 20-like [Lethenteron reissneri]|uniref:leucine-rich repeat-containing protein 20-like n=1 Tax=Lethenteron reissneri TaxID=7753 RepID=UPI002AB6487D|nr:leucine-rich repeat-containing protein 20-like [Lethenteron reissneri]XP_061427171.1 leucine-rich repeat-containing protein 20-like [Lethenteron reissneri]